MKKLIFILALLPFVACKQEGCIDPSAINYSSEAEKDDGTCTYNGRAVCWFTSVTATNCVNASIPAIDFYIDGVQQGSVSVTQFSTVQAECGGSEGITAVLDLGTGESVSKAYKIMEGGTSNVLQSGTVLVSKDVCHWIEFNY